MGPRRSEACGRQEEALHENQKGTLSLDIMLGKMLTLVAELNFILPCTSLYLISCLPLSISMVFKCKYKENNLQELSFLGLYCKVRFPV